MRLALFGFHLAAVPIVVLPVCMFLGIFVFMGITTEEAAYRWALAMAIMAALYIAAIFYRKVVRKHYPYELPRIEYQL